MGNYYVYILALENEKYYVGISRDVYKRYYEHVNRKGAHFTRIHHPVGLVCMRELNCWSKELAEQEETKMTLFMMTLFGVENVRGGDYFQADFKDVKMALGDSLYNAICKKFDSVDRAQELKRYPEIQMGLELIKNRIGIPINLTTYHMWPTKSFYDKAMIKKEEQKAKVHAMTKICLDKMSDEAISQKERERLFKELVSSVIDEIGEFRMTVEDEDGIREYVANSENWNPDIE